MKLQQKHKSVLQTSFSILPYALLFTLLTYHHFTQPTPSLPIPTPNLSQHELRCQVYNRQLEQTTKIVYTSQFMYAEISSNRDQVVYYSGDVRGQLGKISGYQLMDVYHRLCSNMGDADHGQSSCGEPNCIIKTINIPVSTNTVYKISLANTKQKQATTDYSIQPSLNNQPNTETVNSQPTHQPQQQSKPAWAISLYFLVIFCVIFGGMYALYNGLYRYQHNGRDKTDYSDQINHKKEKITSSIQHLFDTKDRNFEQFQFVNKIIRKKSVGDWFGIYLLRPAIQQPLNIKILKMGVWPINVGIIHTTTSNTGEITKQIHRCMVYGSNGTYFNGNQYKLSNSAGFTVGDTIKIGMDVENKVVKWTVKGVVVNEVVLQYDREEKGDWRFMVQMRGKDDEFELVL